MYRWALCAALLLFSVGAAANQIPRGYVTIAMKHNIPPSVLYAVVSQESMVPTNKGRSIPWPWTVNFKGDGKRFESRQALYAYCQQLLNRGETLFDIGAGQVNWHWHHQRFDGDLWLATSPSINIDTAATILAEWYAAEGDWWTAVGKYHSPGNRQRAKQYSDRVKKRWLSIVQ